MVEYIQEYHPDDSGIIYCLSKKVTILSLSGKTTTFIDQLYQDTEQVAEAIMSESNGRIKTGVYHADVPDGRKMKLHEDWRKGEIKVVCATIGEGLLEPFSS